MRGLQMSNCEILIILENCIRTNWLVFGRIDGINPVGRVTFAFIANVRFALECNYFKFSLFSGFLLIGHGSLNEYLHKRGLASSSSCHNCGEVVDVTHVLCNCPLYDDVRNLSNKSIVLVNNTYMLLNVLCSRESFYEFERFASRTFMRRKSLLK